MEEESEEEKEEGEAMRRDHRSEPSDESQPERLARLRRRNHHLAETVRVRVRMRRYIWGQRLPHSWSHPEPRRCAAGCPRAAQAAQKGKRRHGSIVVQRPSSAGERQHLSVTHRGEASERSHDGFPATAETALPACSSSSANGRRR